MSLAPGLIGPLLDRVFAADRRAVLDELKTLREAVPRASYAHLLRVAAGMGTNDLLYFQQLHNLWSNAARPHLKPGTQHRRLLLLTDYTASQVVAPLEVLAAARGVNLQIRLPPFDSVEQQALAGASGDRWHDLDVIVLSLSDHWLDRYLGGGALVAGEAVERTGDALARLVAGLADGSGAKVLVTSLLPPAYPGPNGCVRLAGLLGRRLAVGLLNARLSMLASDRVGMVDTETAIHLAGGRAALGRRSYLLAKMAYERDGAVAVARELAAAVAGCFGQGHRALVLDWDNTLWGGEIGESGVAGVVCGFDSPEANGYRLLQEHIRGLRSAGVLLATASRNDPRVADLIDASSDIPLSRADFAALAIDFQPKSLSLAAIADQLGFGTEYMVFVDDSAFELAEVFCAHPDIDLFQASPEADLTLERLSAARYFGNLFLQAEDLARAEMAAQLGRARLRRAAFASDDAFLDSINIALAVAPWGAGNKGRILQLLQKTNQFNLTTRRHGEADIEGILARGGEVLAFSYRDVFGTQGIVSVLITLPGDAPGERSIDTWLMSCRVLNRTVEQGVFDWYTASRMVERLVGSHIPTAKNGLVAGLYPGLGFAPLGAGAAATTHWLWRRADHRRPPHFIKRIEED